MRKNMNVQSEDNKNEDKVSYGSLTELAIRIYALDTKVYELVGSSLGRTFSGDEKKSINGLVELMSRHPQGYKLRSEIALIGNMARTIKDKEKRSMLMREYNEILHEIEKIPSSFGSVDILDKNFAGMNHFNNNGKRSKDDHLIICISRTEGSAGTDIGFALADELRINYYDAEVFGQVLEHMDKEKDAKWESKKVALHNAKVNAKVREFSRYHGLSKRDAMFFNESELLCQLAKEQDFIVIGRCADVILTNNHIPHISVFITAPLGQRVRRIMELEGMSFKDASKRMVKRDHSREHFYRFYTGKQWGSAANYDLCINSARYGIEESVELIKRIIYKEKE